jgi:hypothetical protein
MTQTIAEARFEQSRKKLAESLKTLQKIVEDKIFEAGQMQARALATSENSQIKNQARIVEQSVLIQNLTNEINNLQNSLFEMGKEAEMLRKKNEYLMLSLEEIYQEKSNLVDAIELDLLKIEKVINR